MNGVNFAEANRLYLKSLGQNKVDVQLEDGTQTPRQQEVKAYSIWGLTVSFDQVVAFLLFCDLMFLCIIILIVLPHDFPCLSGLISIL